MSTVVESIDVDVPVRAVYERWATFEEFPRFMDGVEEVRQLDDRRAHWRTRIAGLSREFETEVVERVPDERVAWRTTGESVKHTGTVDFEPLGPGRTRVTMTMVFRPTGLAERAADRLGVLGVQVRGDLRRFKRYVEDAAGDSTGAE
ncbi:SRPBCC family protein [Kitasatospora sp. NPDC093550]|uniref:SRPBCC family protein n=1 Tax=Kitasatospora sp. NPDC093550 TaxID=3364089 RepID=UPI0037F2585B